MFYSSFNKKKTKLLKYTAKACNTQKKKTYNTEIEEEKTYDTEIEKEGKKKLYDTDIDHHPFPRWT